MIRTLPFLLLVPLGLPAASQKKPDPKPDVFAVNKALGRGVNLGNALEAAKEGDWGMKIVAELPRLIKKVGFDTVRVPVKWSAHAGKDAPYAIDPAFFKRIDWVLDRATENRLNVVLTVHHYSEVDRDPDKLLPRLVPSGNRSHAGTRTARRRSCSSCSTNRTTSSWTRSGTTPSHRC